MDESVERGLSVYAEGSASLIARGRIAELGFNEPLIITNLAVKRGDLAVADGSGAVVLLTAVVRDVVAAAEHL